MTEVGRFARRKRERKKGGTCDTLEKKKKRKKRWDRSHQSRGGEKSVPKAIQLTK